MNKVIKRIAKHSNYKNVGKRILEMWSVRSAYLLSKCSIHVDNDIAEYNTSYQPPAGG